jgi:hypothetical protein
MARSNVNDETREVAYNAAFNFELNKCNISPNPCTCLILGGLQGTGWPGGGSHHKFDTIDTHDILIYVSEYPTLVQTLEGK